MNLSVNVIYHELKPFYSKIKEPILSLTLQKCSPNDSLALFKPPLFQTGAVNLSSGNIYVVSSNQIPENLNFDGQCLFIMPESISRLERRKNISVIEVPNANVEELFNHVLQIYMKYSEWDRSLQELVFTNSNIEDFLKASFNIIGNPMSIHNNNFNYIAKYNGNLPGDNLSKMHTSNFFDPDFLLKADDEVEDSIFYSRNVIFYEDKKENKKYFFLNLFNGNTAAGRLVVVNDHRDFLPQDYALITHLGKYLETILSYVSYTGSGRNLRRDSLYDYISGKSHSEEKIIHLKTVSPFSHLKKGQELFVAVCARQNTDLSEQYISIQLERALPESVCIIYEDRFVILCANQPGQTLPDFFDSLNNLLKKYNLICGLSNPFQDFFDMKFCYKEAVFVLSETENRINGERLNFFKDHTLEHLLKFGTSVLPSRLVCAECVIKLAEHDKSSTVSYCDSLKVYLDSGRNMMECARLLNIKRNTFLARLERIMRFVDLDLDDENNRLYVQMSLHLIQLQNM